MLHLTSRIECLLLVSRDLEHQQPLHPSVARASDRSADATQSIPPTMAATGASNPVQNPRVGTPVEHSEPILIQPRVKWLQRIGSSPSLRQFGRRRAISNPGSSASMSCASLASAGSPRPDSSYGSPLSIGGYSTAPTTPGIDTPGFDGIKGKLAIRGASGAVTAGHTTPTLLYGSSMCKCQKIRSKAEGFDNSMLKSNFPIPGTTSLVLYNSQ